LLYSDGSTDDTDAIARELAAGDPRVRFVRGERRLGKPTALNQMREAAKGDVLLMTDIRQPLAPGSLRALVARSADARVGCVSGTLALAGSWGTGLYWRYEKWIRRQEGRFRGMVGVTGSIYAIRRADLPRVPPHVILDDVWIPMSLRLRGYRTLFCEQAV